MVIAVVDTGVDLDHPDLAANIWTNPGETAGNGIDDDNNGFVDDTRGWDFVNVTSTSSFAENEDIGPADNDPTDGHGHGTIVAGVAAAAGNNAAGVCGVAWNCRIMPLRVGIKEGITGNAYVLSSWVADGILYAGNNGADVINLSLIDRNWPGAVKDAVDHAWSRGAVIVGAAGNYGESTPPAYPAAYEKVIGVGATDQNDRRSVWSIAVPPAQPPGESDFGTWIDVAAPGTNLLTTFLDGAYGTASGNSISCAFVSGLAALVRSQHPEFTNEEVMRVIRSCTDRVDSDKYIGTGRVNVARALAMSAVPLAQITSPVSDLTVSSDVTFIGSATCTNFASYTLACAERLYPAAWTIFVNGAGPVESGMLGTWDVDALADNTFYTVRLSVTDTLGNTSIDEVVIYVQKNVVSGWPKVLSGVQIDGDGVAMADVDDNGDLEVAVTVKRSLGGPNQTYGLNLFNHDGTPCMGWPQSNLHRYGGGPTFVDLNGNGDREVIVAGYTWGYPASTTKFHVFNQNGSYLQGWPQTYVSSHAYVDGDSDLEIIVHTNSDQIYVYHHTSAVASGWPVNTTPAVGNECWAQALVGDVNGDGQLDVALAYNTTVDLWDLGVPVSQADLLWPEAWHDAGHAGAYCEPDVEDPTVSLTALPAGTTVQAQLTLTASAGDNVRVAGVRSRVDGVAIGEEDTSSPYAVIWDTRLVANGNHTLTAVARDSSGNQTVSSAVPVTVDNPPAPPADLAAAAISSTTVRFTWRDMANDEDGYRVLTATGGVLATLSPGATVWYRSGLGPDQSSAARGVEAFRGPSSSGIVLAQDVYTLPNPPGPSYFGAVTTGTRYRIAISGAVA